MVSSRKTDPKFLIAKANQSIDNLNRFKSEAKVIIKQVREKLSQIDALVKENLATGTNLDGFLLGKINEYKLILDQENFDLRCDLDIELWEAQIRNAEETQEQAKRIENAVKESKT